MRRIILSLILVTFLSSCCAFRRTPRRYEEYFDRIDKTHVHRFNPEYQELVEVIFGSAVEQRYTKNLTMCQSCAIFDEELQLIRLRFTTLDLLELQEARTLLVDLVEGLLNRLKSYEPLRGSLLRKRVALEDELPCTPPDTDLDSAVALPKPREYVEEPFGYDDLEVIIDFESFHGIFVDPSYVGRIDLRHGEVLYSSFEVFNSDYDTWGCKREPYSLSKQLVSIERRAGSPYIEQIEGSPASSHAHERYIPNWIAPSSGAIPPPPIVRVPPPPAANVVPLTTPGAFAPRGYYPPTPAVPAQPRQISGRTHSGIYPSGPVGGQPPISGPPPYPFY